uniref:Small ribosomal subunit protein uS5m n=1 Tax=Evadne anonyx TaxID=141404 RepID=A0A9N6WQ03_9CRUS|nr:EOG090X0689 [Evadne anonyx]
MAYVGSGPHSQGPAENMAGLLKITSRVLRISQTLVASTRNNYVLQAPNPLNSLNYNGSLVSNIHNPITVAIRHTSFFNRLPAEMLWKGVLSVSNAGKKRGRGKGAGKKNARNLNRGQAIGVGVNNMLWPGLNSPVMKGKELMQQAKLPEDPDRQARLLNVRDNLGGFKMLKLNPLERGWSGVKLPGRSLGPPDPIGEDSFEGFDTKVLEFKTVSNMSGNLGRTRRASAFVITGNNNGLAGFALAKANMGQTALRKAKNRCAQKLIFVERYNEHTVLHDFFTQFGKTKIFVQKKPEGYGLVCHRALRTICQVIGIKDLYAKVEGSTRNIQNLTKAFMLGLIQQKTYNKIAEESQLNVVELRKECEDFPCIIAKPSQVKSTKTTNQSDFSLFLMEGKVPSQKKKYPLFFKKLPSWQVHLSKTVRFRNHNQVRTNLVSEYGEVRSFLADKYPECRKIKYVKQKAEEDDD